MTMIAYAFLQHHRLASDVILEALASSACDAALQMAWSKVRSRCTKLRDSNRRSMQTQWQVTIDTACFCCSTVGT
jgi:hypothetical protein